MTSIGCVGHLWFVAGAASMSAAWYDSSPCLKVSGVGVCRRCRRTGEVSRDLPHVGEAKLGQKIALQKTHFSLVASFETIAPV